MLFYRQSYDSLKITALISYDNNSKQKRELGDKNNTVTCYF